MTAYGYARVSTHEQTTDPQTHALRAAGVPDERITAETISGAVAAQRRPVLSVLLARLASSDSLVVVRLDRLGRDPADVLSVLRELDERGVAVRLLDMGADTGTPAGRLVVGVLAAVAGWERDVLRERTREGLASAAAQGRKGGRRPALTLAQVAHAHELRDEGKSLRDIASILRGRYGQPSPESIRRALLKPRG